MPALQLTTNVQVPDTQAYVLQFSKLASETLGKPEQFFSINFNYNPTLTFAGTFDPAILLVITCLDALSPEANEKYSKAFFDHFKETLGVPGDRGYITFYDPQAEYIATRGMTVATLRKSQ
ncbi:hypothetical protein JAAARDRAFT_626597 [Jaapia argillacea MUCL 33604]|uniref:L-dopachrome isomerase n=1 Tax=Jaapia argillacea MUCL 33604 TaxID=933084 RepID=A0A067QAI7_9AGAM|nr:hypothetical protein JAAARDRAFT_626597 [Jaapia argillacea MUCL 33604]